MTTKTRSAINTPSSTETRCDSLFREARSNARDCSAFALIVYLSHLLPTTAECFIELYDAEQFITADQGQTSFRFEEFAIGVERVEQRCNAARVTQVGKARAISQSVDEECALGANLLDLLICNQGI